jgi:hypothetical protein
MIRSNPFAVALISALFLLSLGCAWSAGWWWLGARELQQLKGQYQWMNQNSSAVQSLANEAMEYSRRNPGIIPILKQFEVPPQRPGSSTGAAPETSLPTATP